jgi:hypothetical protein
MTSKLHTSMQMSYVGANTGVRTACRQHILAPKHCGQQASPETKLQRRDVAKFTVNSSDSTSTSSALLQLDNTVYRPTILNLLLKTIKTFRKLMLLLFCAEYGAGL